MIAHGKLVCRSWEGDLVALDLANLDPIRAPTAAPLTQARIQELLTQLLAHATQPQYEYRHKWQLGDLVMWDNRCLLHKANGDYDMDQMRYLYRVMLKGDAPR